MPVLPVVVVSFTLFTLSAAAVLSFGVLLQAWNINPAVAIIKIELSFFICLLFFLSKPSDN